MENDGQDVIETSSEETIDEVTTDETPETDEETDKVENDAADETTFEDDELGADQEDYFLGTFKTKEEAENSLKSSQAKITEQGNQIAELTKQIEAVKNPPKTPEVKYKEAETSVTQEFSQRFEGLGYKYSSYIPDGADINSPDDLIANLPPQQASQFTAEFMGIKNEFDNTLKTRQSEIYQEQVKHFETQKAADQERFKGNQMVFDAWYTPPQTIDDVANLFDGYKTKVIQDYIKEKQAHKEDQEHKQKLDPNAGKGRIKGQTHVYTEAEIAKMSDTEFKRHEKAISQQYAKGIIVA